jgi:hypothetical protein
MTLVQWSLKAHGAGGAMGVVMARVWLKEARG